MVLRLAFGTAFWRRFGDGIPWAGVHGQDGERECMTNVPYIFLILEVQSSIIKAQLHLALAFQPSHLLTKPS